MGKLEMGTLEYVIETRQKADLLAVTRLPLGAGGSFESAARLVLGYAEVSILAISDQPFSIRVLEATRVRITDTGVVEGNFVQVQDAIVAVASGAQFVVCTRIRPCGIYIKFLLENTGLAMGALTLDAYGLPLP